MGLSGSPAAMGSNCFTLWKDISAGCGDCGRADVADEPRAATSLAEVVSDADQMITSWGEVRFGDLEEENRIGQLPRLPTVLT